MRTRRYTCERPLWLVGRREDRGWNHAEHDLALKDGMRKTWMGEKKLA